MHSQLLLILLLQLLLLLALSDVPLRAHAQPPLPYSNSVIGPYTLPPFSAALFPLSTLRISSPESLIGTLLFMQSGTGPMFIVNSSSSIAAGNFDLTYTVEMPHSEDDPQACQPLQHDWTDEGTPLSGSLLLIGRGTCKFLEKLNNAAAVSAAVGGIINCHGCSPEYMSAVSATLIPSFLMFESDGALITSYLSARRAALLTGNASALIGPNGENYTQPVVATVVGTSALKSNERNALKEIASMMTLDFAGGAEDGGLIHWHLLTDTDLDPCINRIAGQRRI
jgi:hypothetical protein